MIVGNYRLNITGVAVVPVGFFPPQNPFKKVVTPFVSYMKTMHVDFLYTCNM